VTVRRFRKTRATSVHHWAPKCLMNASNEVLAKLPASKVAQVARMWRKHWHWKPSAITRRLQDVARARQELKESRRIHPPIKIAQRVLRRSPLGTTEPEVIAMMRAICTPEVDPYPPVEEPAVVEHAHRLRELARPGHGSGGRTELDTVLALQRHDAAR